MNTPRIVVAARSERGVSMIFTLLSLAMVTVLGLGLTSVAMSTVSQAVAESETTEALAIADAGIEHGKQLVLWQDWQSLNVFLQRGDGTGCNYDELAGTPINIPLPAGYPTDRRQLHSCHGARIRPGTLLRRAVRQPHARAGGAGAEHQQRPEHRRGQGDLHAQRRLRPARVARGRRADARRRRHAGRGRGGQPRGEGQPDGDRPGRVDPRQRHRSSYLAIRARTSTTPAWTAPPKAATSRAARAAPRPTSTRVRSRRASTSRSWIRTPWRGRRRRPARRCTRWCRHAMVLKDGTHAVQRQLNTGCAYTGLPGGPAGSGIAPHSWRQRFPPAGTTRTTARRGAPRGTPRTARTTFPATSTSRPTRMASRTSRSPIRSTTRWRTRLTRRSSCRC